MDLLIIYNREDGFDADWKEKLGNAALGSLRLAFGKMVTVTMRGEMKPHVADCSQKAIAIAALVLLSPIYLIAIPIGFAATILSSTYGKNLPFPLPLRIYRLNLHLPTTDRLKNQNPPLNHLKHLNPQNLQEIGLRLG